MYYVVQNVYSKAATLILQERMQVTPVLVGKNLERRTSRWFQLDTDDIDDFREEFRAWKTCGGFDNRPPPLIIETYLDTSRLNSGQSLVALDEHGKRWDVVEAINSSDQSSDSSTGRQGKPTTHVVLERWRIELKGAPADDPDDFGPLLPTVYKKAIVLMRSIYTTTGVLPAWRLARNSKTKGIHPALTTRCRVSSGNSRSFGSDTLRTPLFEGRGDVTTDYMFGDLEVPVGRFYVSVCYRNHCAFQVVETESLLSSRIGMAIPDDMFMPSLPRRTQSRNETLAHEVGSLPYQRHVHNIAENQQRYGSLSTFHGEGPVGTSPISALRAVKAPGSDTASSPDSRPASIEGAGHPLPISSMARRASIRTTESLSRRPSVSFQSSPFKHGSLSGSPIPRMQDQDVPPSPRASGANTTAAAHVRNRSSLIVGMPASLRGGPPPTTGENSVAGSPRPSSTNRFSSSFTHRRNRPSFGGASRAEDDQMSSGKQSLSSSVVQPSSGLLNDTGAGGSSGSFQTDDDSIQDFLKALDSKRTLQSFEPSKKSESATKRTTAQLSKFHLMRESNNALTESLNSSMQLQRSSSTFSRQLANVPGMSASSSPGKPLSPHTPHTPAIPSRLSENSSVDYAATARAVSRQRHEVNFTEDPPASAPVTFERTTAIDIPLSPRPYPHGRRSSSVAHQPRVPSDDDDGEAQRSLSLGAEDREIPSLSALLVRAAATADEAINSPVLQPPAHIRAAGSVDTEGRASSSAEREVRPPGGLFSSLSASPYSRRYSNIAGRGATPPPSGSDSLVGSYRRYGRGYSRGGAAGGPGGASTEEMEDEPLLFDMSEINREQSRRSLEENRDNNRTAIPGGRGARLPKDGPHGCWIGT
ncbi:putative autophagy protein Atg13 [Rosellinia necatrix]|uniref:Autophagy-related protein 13 n=1 Tax=Rosellinia necatrix TaxID=77044 RepID=A0A1W2TV59_ROSNE|nr:putative autophagy protein Atg13 [Rosellinia necatrix]